MRFGESTIEYQVQRSKRRKKTVQITVDGGGVQVASPVSTPEDELRRIVRKRAAWILRQGSAGDADGSAETLCERRDAAVSGSERTNVGGAGGRTVGERAGSITGGSGSRFRTDGRTRNGARGRDGPWWGGTGSGRRRVCR